MSGERLRRWLSGALLAWACAGALPAGAQVVTGRGFGQSIVGFDDVNGNGVLDCFEPVTIEVFYADPASDATTGAVSGQMVAPFAGATGLAFIPGSVEIDHVHTVGNCTWTIATGNEQSDVEATLDFSCGPPSSAGPGNTPGSNVVAFLYRAAFIGTQPSYLAVARGTTSDGLDQTPQLFGNGNIGTTCPAGGGTPSVTVTKTAAGTGVPGSMILYTIAVKDLTGLGVGGLQLTDVVPAETTFDQAASSPGWVCPASGAGSLCRLAAGNLPAGGTVTAYFAVDLAPALPAGVSSVSNTACARSGPSTVLGCGSVSVPTAGKPNLTLAKGLASGKGNPGSTVVYSLTVGNSGNQDTGPVTLAETVPANTTWSGGGGWSCAGSGAGSSCHLTLPNLPAGGGTATAQFPVVVANPLPAGVGTIANTACADAAGAAEACSTLTIPTTGTPLLAVQKVAAGTGAPGSNLVYSITVQNTGNQGASGVVVSEVVPALTSFVAAGSSPSWSCSGTAAGSTCTAAVGTLGAGASAALTFVVAITSPLPAGASAIGNMACAVATGVQSACGSTSTPTTGQPVLHLVKSYAGGPVLPNALLVFQLAVSNSGNQDLGAAVVSETVPALSSFDATASDPRWSCMGSAAGSGCTLDLPGVAAGSSQTIAFAVRAAAALPPAAVVGNAACVTGMASLPAAAARSLRAALRRGARGARAAQTPAPEACGSVSTPPALAVQTTLAAAVEAHPAPALPGDRIRYTLTVPNQAASALTALLAQAALDPNTTLVPGSVTTTQGTVTTGNGGGDTTVAVALGDLAGGGSAEVSWEVTVNAHLPAGLTQVAAQVETTGTNIPPDESGPPPPPSTPGPTTTPVAAGSGPPPPQAIPTLSGWGLGTMIVLLGAMAAAVVRRRGAA